MKLKEKTNEVELIEFGKDMDYLDEQFPKGKTKFRGQAMVLLAFAREEGKSETKKEFLEFLEDIDWSDEPFTEVQEKIRELEKK